MERISTNALAHIQDLLEQQGKAQRNLAAWKDEALRLEGALHHFLRFLDVEHTLGAADIIDKVTGEIQRANATTPSDDAAGPVTPKENVNVGQSNQDMPTVAEGLDHGE